MRSGQGIGASGGRRRWNEWKGARLGTKPRKKRES